MRKKILIPLFILIFAALCAVFYLNKVILPLKIKALIIRGIEESTQKKASLGSVQFSIFKGLVLRDLIIYDGTKRILAVKEASASFLFLPVFKKNVILPVVKLKEPEIFLERRGDNTLNLADLFLQAKEEPSVKERTPAAEAGADYRKKSLSGTVKGGGFNIFVKRIILAGGRINFQDDTLSPVFTKSLDNLDADIFLSLPSVVRFSFNCRVVSRVPAQASVRGSFDIASERLVSKVALKNISLADFSAYCKDFGFSLPQGTIGASADVEVKDRIFCLHADAKADDIIIAKDAVRVGLSSELNADIKYSLKDSQLFYQGKAKLSKSSISGLDFIGEINDIAGLVNFDNNGLFSDKITANLEGVFFEAGVKLSDYKRPTFSIDITGMELAFVQKILKDKFNIALPADITGKAGLFMAIKSESAGSAAGISGYLDIIDAGIKFGKMNASIEGVGGRVEFSRNGLSWQGLGFKYLGAPYVVSGTLTDFALPQISLALSSEELSCQAAVSVKGKTVTLTQLKGRYLNSEFLLSGQIQLENLEAPCVMLSLGLDLDLKDIRGPLKSFQNQLKDINPSGRIQGKLDLSGNISNFKSCEFNAQFSSPSVSVYGLKASDLSLICRQQAGILEVPSLRFSSYDGTVDLSAALNLNTQHLPYRVNAVIKDVKIEKLKLDTPAKEKEIAGTIQAQVNLNGFETDLSRTSGQGTVNITEGKLWQLNLFQGLGKLIFAEDFANIRFSQGSCGFVIRDRCVFSDSIKLKSTLVELSGTARIGFDSSIDATVKIHVLDNALPLTNTLKDVATAIIGESGSFGRIKISGTLKEPKYKFQPAIGDIIKGLKDSLLESIVDF